MKSKNSPTTDSLRLLFNSSGKTNLKSCNKYVASSNLSIYYTRKNKKVIKNNKLKIPAPTYMEKLELPDRSYFVSDILDYFEHIIKKHKIVTDVTSITMYIIKIGKRIYF